MVYKRIKRSLVFILALVLLSSMFAYAGQVTTSNADNKKDFNLFYFNFIDGDYISKSIKLNSEIKDIEKELIIQVFNEINIPKSVYDYTFSKNISLVDVNLEGEKIIVNLDIKRQDFECLSNLASTLTKTIFENFRHIKEIKLLNNGIEIDSSDSEIDFTATIIRTSSTEDEYSTLFNKDNVSRVIPDVPNPVIVIDPGHGGKFNHAQYGNFLEKNVVLEISKKLKGYLEAKGATVYLTRSGDYHLKETDKEDCHARGRIAAEKKADMFISIHCNGFNTASANGIEVFYKDERYSDSTLSKSLAKNIVDQMHIFTGMKKRQGGSGIAPKNYWVFQTSETPSVLIEAGFITNSYDRKYLTTSSGQNTLAKSIYVGIRKWWWGY
ncbi:N-acetylmuramoyl-L-alanine amidase family protein [Paramaledivibacter caminithermalis]|jgi:N-acetylmuramoyl-L-alanine amidase|uniref:N-acetylmuramoyl-L-alanine amidase n=1 Tax=Paramaledivibacter caminithermalis (strain DSM 15212 / CIP 107654 / DViRD3) TaxID=1121301 RepID=A0A1M6RP14_PARC5|nr:N-acetylmuramoyl-L-alanine amidase [Paramaledivibacter caminithermalis]SHK34057.1 N-acetylmuramoyl-L-alanine amidase [Paramaledivibacter caminithermalis DSM 15212]